MAAMRSCSAPSCSVSLACRSRSVCTRALGSAPRPAGLRVAHRHARLVVRRGSEGEGVEGAESGASKSVLSRENPDLVERFAVVGGGSAECKSCQYVYEPKLGDPEYPVAKGTLFQVRCGRPSQASVVSRQASLLTRTRAPAHPGPAPRLALPHLRRGEEAVRVQGEGGGRFLAEPRRARAPFAPPLLLAALLLLTRHAPRLRHGNQLHDF